MIPTQEWVRDLFRCDPENGHLWWREIGRGRIVTKPVGYWDNGYLRVKVEGRRYMVHALIWLYVHGEWRPRGVDHRDLDGANNKLSNLRAVSESQNCCNRRKRSDNTSGFKGVFLDKKKRLWRAQIAVNGEYKYLGRFKRKEDAYAAYCEGAKRFHKEFARL